MKLNFYKLRIQAFRYLLLGCVVVSSQEARSTELMVQRTEAGERLENVLKKMEQKFNVNFVYDANEINKNLVVDIANLSSSLESALQQLSSHGLVYKKVGTNIILKKEIKQKITVKGTVTAPTPDGTGTESLPGVNVSEKGSNSGTSTNANGEYTITVSGRDAVLVFSFLGYRTEEVPLNGRASVNVKLEEDVNSLKQVVVTGYQNIDKKVFTGAAVSVKGEDVKIEGLTDVSRMLEGRVAGVSVQTVSGTFGAAPKIRVRGATSITGENKPLWVIDGVVLEDVVNVSNDQLASGDPNTLLGSPVAGINPEDIESFNILKDASATALYGARAMNGVVVITTKRGKTGAPKVNYTGNFSTFLKPSYSSFNIMNSAEQMSVFSEIARKGYLNGSIIINRNSGVYGKLYRSLDYDPETGEFGVENTPEGREAFLLRYAQANTDWFDLLFRNSFAQEHNISISSGSEKSKHYFSGSFYNDNGWTIADNVKRYTMKLRNDYTISPKITVGVMADGSLRRQRVPGSEGREDNVVEGRYSRNFDINPFSYALNTSRTMTAYDENGELEYFTRNWAPFNILNELKNNYIDLNVLDTRLQGEVNYKINSKFEFRSLGAMRYVKTTNEHQITEFSNTSLAYRSSPSSVINNANIYLYLDPDDPAQTERISVLPQGGFYNRSDNSLLNFYVRNQLSYNNENKLHNISGFLGQEIKYSDRQNSFSNGYGYQYDSGGVPFTDYKIFKQLLEANYNYYDLDKFYDRYASFFANGKYAYNNKYIFNATFRFDGSNKQGQSSNARWLPTYTFSGAWNIDEESFMTDVESISYLKLRSSYGLTASIGNASNSLVVLQNGSTFRPSLSDNESKISIQDLENSELTWEKQYEFNVGSDVGLFKNRLNISMDYYRRNGFDLIGRIRTSGIGGESVKLANYADMKSHGFEFSIGGTPIDQKDSYRWRTNLTFGYNKNKVTRLKNEPRIYDLIIPEGGAFEGGPVRGLYSIDFQRLDELGIPVFINEEGVSSTDVYVQSSTTDYLKYEGPVEPTITGGFSNTFSYKSLSINAFITYQAGNKIRLNSVFKSRYDDTDAMPREFLDRWTLPLDEQYTNVPSIADYVTNNMLDNQYPYTAFNYSTERVVDGSFVRLKTVSIDYSLNKKLVNSLGLNSASLSLRGTNLALLYADKKLKGQDPEFFTSGGVALPVPRQFTLTLKVGI